MQNTDGKKPQNSPQWEIIIRTQGNRNNYLIEALYSIALQNYKNFLATIVAHTNIKENILKIKQILKNFNGILNIKLLVLEDTSLKRGAPLNLALNKSNARYISFLDDDDVLYSSMGNELIKEIYNKKCNFVYGNSYFLKQSSREKYYYSLEKLKGFGEEIKITKLLTQNLMPINSYIYDRNIFETIRFDEKLDLYEDWEFLIQLACTKKLNPKYLPVPVSEYRIRSDKTGSFDQNASKMKLSAEYIRKKYKNVKFEIEFEEAKLIYGDPNGMYNESIDSDFSILLEEIKSLKRDRQKILENHSNPIWLLKRFILTLLRQKLA